MKPKIPASGQQLYDELMAKIEPELTTAQLPLLAEKYKDETPEQAKARAERYTKAYAEYDSAYATYMGSARQQVSQYRKDAFQSLEKEDRTRDQAKLSAMESILLPNTATV